MHYGTGTMFLCYDRCYDRTMVHLHYGTLLSSCYSDAKLVSYRLYFYYIRQLNSDAKMLRDHRLW